MRTKIEKIDIVEKPAGESITEYVKNIIKENIINLNIPPGSLISENAIARQLGLSKTPVREAFLDLSKIGLVEIFPQKGTRVSKIDLDMVEETTFLRCICEKAIVEILCSMDKNALEPLDESIAMQKFYLLRNMDDKFRTEDDQFHRLMYDICGKNRTYSIVNDYVVHLNRLRYLTMQVVPLYKLCDDHVHILEEIKAHHRETAAKLLEEHIMRFEIDKSAAREKFPDYFVL
ncbi:MAG: GntR family transcriptional regulator [Clostridiales bacterium]|nr:GntR family transcriptional regulator [Clostridiales bacterium]